MRCFSGHGEAFSHQFVSVHDSFVYQHEMFEGIDPLPTSVQTAVAGPNVKERGVALN
jgi:hypothetical protein